MNLLTYSVVKLSRQKESDADADTLAWHGLAMLLLQTGEGSLPERSCLTELASCAQA